MSRAGRRWITQYHIRPNPELTAWIREHNAVVITTIRHPADVLISLYHHLHDFHLNELDSNLLRRMLSEGFARTGLTTYSTGQPFFADLVCSLEWMAIPETRVVRYEDLRADPMATLRQLTGHLAPVPDSRIEDAIDMCDIGLLRAMAGSFGGFFREGRIGGWRDSLPAEIAEILRSEAPNPTQTAMLGYSMDPADPLIDRQIRPRLAHPMVTLERFRNGVPVAPILRKCFFWVPRESRTAWENQLDATGADSFFEWLSLPCTADGAELYQGLPLSNLAAFIHGDRPDLRLAFPNLSHADRYEYLRWFLRSALTEYGLDPAFIGPVRAGLLRWANASSHAANGIQATNFVLHICRSRTDVLGSFPHIQGVERRQLVRAVIRTARAMQMDSRYIDPLERSLGRHWLPNRILELLDRSTG